MEKTQPLIAVVPSPGMGHLIPLAEFAKLLISRFHLSVSLILPTTAHKPNTAQLSFLDSLPAPISYTFLPPVDLPDLPETAAPEVTISLVLAQSLPSFRATLGSLAQRARVVALITDLFGTDLFDVAQEFDIPSYMYFTSNANYLMFLFHLPTLDKTVSCEYRDMPDPLVLPGCVPLHGKDFEDGVQDRKDEAYSWNLYHIKRYNLAKGIFVNSFLDLEHGAIRALQMEDPNYPRVYPIGPIVRSQEGDEVDGSGCLKWLDRQPYGSVLFISFGSGGTLSKEQVDELAFGLERSGQRFLWVVRSPNNGSSFGSYFTGQCEEDPFCFLPKGYTNRIKDQGFLVPSWAPQMKILSHSSIGGFLTHCGWNSILESIVNGVPLIAWPLYAEQRPNSILLEQGLRVALRPSFNERGIVEAEEISKIVKDLFVSEEGKMACHRLNELSNYAKKAIDENGDSTKSLDKVVLSWSISMQTSHMM